MNEKQEEKNREKRQLGVAEKAGDTAKTGDAAKIEQLFRQLAEQARITERKAPSASVITVKEMEAYKFWKTQPVRRLDDDKKDDEQGPICADQSVEKVSRAPIPLLKEFVWASLDVDNESELQELYKLLSEHYVEDADSMFRFNYSAEFLKWALKSPGWVKDWHIGVRVQETGRLVAFISAIPVTLRIRSETVRQSEVNFLCIHKKLRAKRLAPVLIKEVTRRCHLANIWQAVYTAGTFLPSPISTCRYYHLSLNWLKLYDVGFTHLPAGEAPQKMIERYALPDSPKLQGIREMRLGDETQVTRLLNAYLRRFDIAPIFTELEVKHWFMPLKKVMWAYVVENDKNEITDFVSFYSLASTVIGNLRHESVNAAYLYYYATNVGICEYTSRNHPPELSSRLNELIHDAVILANSESFDVMNTLTLMDNSLFLEKQNFGIGDGELHYYLYNYRTTDISGGFDSKLGKPVYNNGSGVGLVML